MGQKKSKPIPREVSIKKYIIFLNAAKNEYEFYKANIRNRSAINRFLKTWFGKNFGQKLRFSSLNGFSKAHYETISQH